MGRWLSRAWLCAGIAFSLLLLGDCGGSKPPGASNVPAKITLTPATSASVQLGNTITFNASAQNGAGSPLTTTFAWHSSDTSILNIAPNGVGCAGLFDSSFSTCTPHNYGTVEVTASALGTTSSPTVIFVHPPIDNITVTGILLNGAPPVQEPCLTQSQTMTVQATAFSQGSDITASVGPFNWSVQNSAVASVTPTDDSAYKFPTKLATVTANTPGLTQIVASANGVSSTSFLQPAESGGGGPFNFFETCPIQNISIQLGPTQTGQTSFATNKGTAQPATATVTDVMGYSSLPNISGAPVLSKIPLTWSASQPGSVASTSCTQLSCSISTPEPGAGTVTASCTPPTCNIGLSQIPPILNSATACTQFTPPSCVPFIPRPVYATTAISGQVNGTPDGTSVIATSMGCAGNNFCTAYLYDLSTAANLAGSATAFPTPPNSLLFSLGGTKAYAGSGFGAQDLNPANLNTANNAFTAIGSVTARVLAVSLDGNLAVLSDTLHTPNEAFIANTVSTASIVNLNIPDASAAAFSPDGLKAFIVANGGNSIYVYSLQQALQNLTAVPPGTGNANLIAFSPNGAFVYFAGSPASGPVTGPALTALNMCDNSIADVFNLTAVPSFIRRMPPLQVVGSPDRAQFITLDQTGMDLITATNTANVISSSNPPPQGSCPQRVTHTVQRIELQQGTLQPVNFFMSPDGSTAYIVAGNFSSVLIYSFATHSVSTAIPLLGNNVTPVSADMTVDGSMIYVAGSDGLLHAISTLSLADMAQIQFPVLPNLENPFCSLNSLTGQACVLDLVAVKP